MDTAGFLYRVRPCSKCPEDTEYYCKSCQCDLCSNCKENHIKDLKSIDHNVVAYCEKINCIPTQEMCVKHPSNVYQKYCETCELALCNSWFGHTSHRFVGYRNHNILNILESYKRRQQKHRTIINTFRKESIYYRSFLLTGIKSDFKTYQTKFCHFQTEMLTKARKMKTLIDYAINDFMYNVFCDFDFKHRCLKQKLEMSKHIASLQIYEHRHEQSAFSPQQFLLSIKTAVPQIKLNFHTNHFSMIESFNNKYVVASLCAIQITERGNRRLGNECLLKRMCDADLHQSFKLKGVHRCYHISCVTIERVWVSDVDNLILTNTTGNTLHRVVDLCNDFYGGLHTVNSESELIYIDKNYNIKKMSKDNKTTTICIERKDYTWTPRCVYWSSFSEDLLVGVYRERPWAYTERGKVTRYNQSGQLTQTIQHDNTGLELYSVPYYITENNNGDVVVSDYTSVVVTERDGRHRFSYTGHPSGSRLDPHGVCTDALSQILVCDARTKTIQMLNKDGEFLAHLLTNSREMSKPLSIGYDINTHRFLVGSENKNKLCVYRYIERRKGPIIV